MPKRQIAILTAQKFHGKSEITQLLNEEMSIGVLSSDLQITKILRGEFGGQDVNIERAFELWEEHPDPAAFQRRLIELHRQALEGISSDSIIVEGLVYGRADYRVALYDAIAALGWNDVEIRLIEIRMNDVDQLITQIIKGKRARREGDGFEKYAASVQQEKACKSLSRWREFFEHPDDRETRFLSSVEQYSTSREAQKAIRKWF